MDNTPSEGYSPVKVIVKREFNPYTKQIGWILFFPEDSACHGRIVCWVPNEGHGEADLRYFWGLRNPYPEDEDKVKTTLFLYEKAYQCAGPFKLKRVKRDSDKMRRMRWSRS